MAKPPHTRAEMRAFYPVCQIAELAAGYRHDLRQQNAFEQAELILRAALDPTIARKSRRGEFVRCVDHFDLLQIAIN
jgi:hypothetical protein